MMLDDLPLEYMHTDISNPSQEGLDFMVRAGIINHIMREYESLEDKADAFDAAMIGHHIIFNPRSEIDPSMILRGLLASSNVYGNRDFTTPFYRTLELTLKQAGMQDFYVKAVNYIIDNNEK